MGTGATRVWKPSWPCPVGAVLGPLRHGAGDPAYAVDEAGRHWLALRGPVGPATLLLESRADLGEVSAEAWGPGAAWALDGVPALLGAEDDPTGFEPLHPVIAETWRRYPHLRVGRTGRVFEALVPAVIEQKVTGQEASRGYRGLVRRFGEPAPGPGADRGMVVLPAAATVRAIPSWEWLRMHIDPARSRALVRAAQVADSLERLAAVSPDEADRRLRTLPGIGVWTSAEVRMRALGDADAVSFGDYHIAKEIGHALLGRDMDDAELAELLEPYRPHRHRVQALLGMRRWRERHGPRMAPRTHLPAN